MNHTIAGWLRWLALSTRNPQPSTCFAQGSAFSYQGRLNDKGSPANALCDLRFQVWVEILKIHGRGRGFVSAAGQLWTRMARTTALWGFGLLLASSCPSALAWILPIVSSGEQHVLAMKYDGTVWAWGYSSSGGLGDYNMSPHKLNTPTAVKALIGTPSSVVAGWDCSFALFPDGTVLDWGDNTFGQLGDNTTSSRAMTMPVKNEQGNAPLMHVTRVTAGGYVSAGHLFALALLDDGTVMAWGDNSFNQLGDGTTTDRHLPVHVLSGPGNNFGNVADIAGGGVFSVARDAAGGVWVWGTFNSAYYTYPTKWSGLPNPAIAVAAGSSLIVVLDSNHDVWAWGSDRNGQLGNGTTTGALSFTPTKITAPSDFIHNIHAISVGRGSGHVLAIDMKGQAWAWGSGSSGELGNGSWSDSSIPVKVSSLSGISEVVAGGDYEQEVSFAIESSGRVWTWGCNINYELGLNLPEESNRNIPCVIPGFAVRSIRVPPAWIAVLIRSRTGLLMAVGDNSHGQAGDGGTDQHLIPGLVSGPGGVGRLSDIIDNAGGASHSVALKSDGTVWAWGDNSKGQLGNRSNTDSHVPVQVLGLGSALSVGAGDRHTVAVGSGGTVWAWGYNVFGELGNGTANDSTLPVQVSGLAGVSEVAVGSHFNVARKADGTVWAWGDNGYGQLGNGTTTGSPTPTQVGGLSNVTAIAAGYYHAAALRSDGTVWGWGSDLYGQLGISGKQSTTPIQVSGLSNVVAVAAGAGHTAALKSDGTVWAWGLNGNGQLGDGTTASRSSPGQVSNLAGVVAIGAGAGAQFTMAATADGAFHAWGANTYGQLGDGTTTDRPVPTAVSGLTPGAFRITSSQVVAKTNLVLNFNSTVGESYFLQCATNLAPGALTTVADGIAGTSLPVLVTNSVSGLVARQFARVGYLSQYIPVAQGLVGYYQFDGDVIDASAYGNQGAATGVDYELGVHGSAGYFSGNSNSFVRVPESSSLMITGALTIAAWVRPGQVSGLNPIVEKDYNFQGYNLYVIGGGLQMRVCNSALTAGTVPVNVWTHVAGVYTGSTILLYVNGALVGSTAAGPLTNCSKDMYLGRWGPPGTGRYFIGLIDGVRIYHRALSAAEIAQIAAGE